MRYANITPSFNWDWFEHRGTVRGIFSSASGSQLTARESWNLPCLQVLSAALPQPTFSRPAPNHSQTCLFSSGNPEEQTFSVSWLVILPNSTRQLCRHGYTVQHLPGPLLTWFKKSHHSHLTRQEELQQAPAGYHYCPKSTDGIKAEKSSRSFSSWHRLLVYWVSCRTPGGSTDEDRVRAEVQQVLLCILPF